MPVYIIRHENEEGIVYANQDANKAILKSMELIKDQHGHILEMWVDNKRTSTIDIVL